MSDKLTNVGNRCNKRPQESKDKKMDLHFVQHRGEIPRSPSSHSRIICYSPLKRKINGQKQAGKLA